MRLNGERGVPLFSKWAEGVTEVDLMLHATGWTLNVVSIVVYRCWSGGMYVTLVVVVRCCLVPSLWFWGVARKVVRDFCGVQKVHGI